MPAVTHLKLNSASLASLAVSRRGDNLSVDCHHRRKPNELACIAKFANGFA